MKKLLALGALAAVLGGCAHRQPEKTVQVQPQPEEPSAVTVESNAQTPASGQSRHIFENDRVRVTRFSLAEGQRVPLPSTPNEMIYPLQDCRVRLDSTDGRTWDMTQRKDQVIWSDAAQSAAETVGSSSCDFVLIEVKQ